MTVVLVEVFDGRTVVTLDGENVRFLIPGDGLEIRVSESITVTTTEATTRTGEA
jgi:hypothetical protein